MNRLIFSVFDNKSRLFGTPIVAANTATMFRMMQDEVRRGGDNNTVAAHPDDFAVYTLGMLDDETGRIAPADPPLVAFECSALVA